MHTYAHSMTKVISLSNVAYTELKSLKKENDSFSDVILNLTNKARRGSLLDFFGKWPGTKEETEYIKKELKKGRENLRLKEAKF